MSEFVLVHGGWWNGWYWGETAARLERDGHTVHAPDLPSNGTDPATLGGLADDAATVRQVVESATEPAVLVGHSYGGMVLGELADHPGVVHSVYLAAFRPDRGQSVLDMLAGGPMPEWAVLREDGALEMTDDVELARAGLCPELPDERVADWFRRSALFSAAALATPSSAPDRSHPETYVVLTDDLTVPPAAQEAMAAGADRVERMAGPHQVMITDPDGLAALLARVVAGAGTRSPA